MNYLLYNKLCNKETLESFLVQYWCVFTINKLVLIEGQLVFTKSQPLLNTSFVLLFLTFFDINHLPFIYLCYGPNAKV